ncbi:hypothetical protein IW261DRAFT_1577241 [Armillaria novae-zelandiae]|uniref:Uncharacterized protein n=1 Tax=Armillaria novae-zelandiae TaxID=153914 RepID=A0AA39N8A4_9AGAR|nr:hypothetical protein IW261DRAFT_1577241 [Armillaria novae-zelandiae]
MLHGTSIVRCFLCLQHQNSCTAVEDAHPYLDAHMDTLNDFGLSDSRYGLALRGRVARIVNLIPTVSRQQEWTRWRLKTEEFNRDKLEFDVSHCLPGEEEYTANASHCVAENDLRPFRMHSLPAPHRPQVAASSAKTSADVAVTMPPARPRPTMIRQPEAAREPAIPPASSLKVELSSFCRLGARLRASVSSAPDPTTPPSINLTQVKRSTRLSKTAQPAPPSLDVKATRPMPWTRTSSRKSKSALPTVSTTAVAKKSGSVYVSDDVVGITEAVDDDIVVPPVKRLHVNDPHQLVLHLQRAYHPVTGEPLLGLKYVSFSAFSEPVQSLSMVKSAISSKGKGKVVEQPSAVDVVDNTIYSRAFHPSVDLQYHEPPSRQALESMKLSLLPAAPDSLTKYVVAGNMSIDAIPIETRILFDLLCSIGLASIVPWLDIRTSASSKGVSARNAVPSASPLVTDVALHAGMPISFARLLPFSTLSPSVVTAAICRGVQRVDRINSEIELLGRAMQLLL